MHILYDLEIIKAISEKSGLRVDGIEYCEGWHDHTNMGISVIGFCAIITNGKDMIIGDPSFVAGDYWGLQFFRKLANESDGVIGFNTRGFDDKVLAAAGIEVNTTYDLLEEVRLAAYGSIDYQDSPKGHSYALGKLAAANGLTKTGDGANAAIEWQKGLHKKVADYCMNDVLISAKILKRGIEGSLKNPNAPGELRLRSL